MLLIEGSDSLGKTTLAKKIVRIVSDRGLPVVYSHMTRPNESVFDFFHDYKKMMNPCAVQDRFHIGGLAYHQEKINKTNLQIINSWVRSVGGIIVVLYAGDVRKYEKRLENDPRGNLLDIDTMCQGNLTFKNYAKNEDCDFTFNILPCKVDNPMFVGDVDAEELASEWIKRRELMGNV